MCVLLQWTITLTYFLFTHTPTPEIYTLSLHDALPICSSAGSSTCRMSGCWRSRPSTRCSTCSRSGVSMSRSAGRHRRSEEHTSELQSRRDLVCRLLLEKKKKKHALKNV